MRVSTGLGTSPSPNVTASAAGMEKKLQIFISSTFSDLRPERQAAVEGVLLSGNIPAGMELFAAGDKSQLEVIKRWIKNSDAYMLIVGARYGSIEPVSGKSYTQLEYEYAQELGLPMFGIVMSDAALKLRVKELGSAMAESATHGAKLLLFRENVLGRVSRFCDDEKDVKLAVLESLREIALREGIVGWVRGGDADSLGKLAQEIDRLGNENERLVREISELQAQPTSVLNLAGLDEIVEVPFSHKRMGGRENKTKIKWTWAQVFNAVGPLLLEHPPDAKVEAKLGEALLELGMDERVNNFTIHRVDHDFFGTVKFHLEALGLVKVSYLKSVAGTMHLYWGLTPKGKQTLMELRAVKSRAA